MPPAMMRSQRRIRGEVSITETSDPALTPDLHLRATQSVDFLFWSRLLFDGTKATSEGRGRINIGLVEKSRFSE
jgi:hypothetical protein